eukprot:Nitzschia sp. Nitz4//scaffold72_size95085//19777//21261//NITZ4_004748-RA/size95085-snap-gene-0.119-mRNA-1//-1//CDS//3329557339//2440//frame0
MSQASDPSSNNNNIPRPKSVLVGPSSQLRAPTSLLSGSLPASLRESDDGLSVAGMNSVVSARPRRLWAVQDASLPRIPKLYPPLNPNCTTYVGDASPSVVAVRIAECLRKRSMAVEYDDESATATVMSVDRCHFQVQLWKGNVTDIADFSHGVVVECLRVRGPALSFYPACRAILQAALGQSTGDDARPMHQTNGLEFPRLLEGDPSRLGNQSDSPSFVGMPRSPKAASPERALEQAMELVKKDRIDTQMLGMERLVDLTTPSICGKETAVFVSLQLVEKNPQWLVDMIQEEEASPDSTTYESTALDSNVTHSTIGLAAFPEEGRHISAMRAHALRILCNTLSTLSAAQILPRVLSKQEGGSTKHPMIDNPMINALVSDLKGANRPPGIVQGTKLASAHETTLAVRILRILGENTPTVKLVLESDAVLERLETARLCGRATHLQLQQETERTYAKLTEDARSC